MTTEPEQVHLYTCHNCGTKTDKAGVDIETNVSYMEADGPDDEFGIHSLCEACAKRWGLLVHPDAQKPTTLCLDGDAVNTTFSLMQKGARTTEKGGAC